MVGITLVHRLRLETNAVLCISTRYSHKEFPLVVKLMKCLYLISFTQQADFTTHCHAMVAKTSAEICISK